MLRRQRWAELCGFEASLVYTVNSRTARGTKRNPDLKKTNKQMIYMLVYVCMCMYACVYFMWTLYQLEGG